MKRYQELSQAELEALKSDLEKQFEDVKGKGLKLDMSRGKPSPAQLDTVMPILSVINETSVVASENGTDCRNYGVLDGIPETKKFMADLIGTKPENVIVCGNASLTIMYDAVARAMIHGVLGNTPWCKQETLKFLCPVPGYDRHFKITESFGIEMISVPMTENGPDMDMVEEYVQNDTSVKGIWCVPKYSNPQGYSYSDETVRRFAALKPAAPDFRIFWDNAYCVHDLYDDRKDTILDIISECEKAGNPNMVFEFCSTSKVSFAGAGISAVASSKENLDWMKKTMTVQSIGYDKMNQLRHVLYYKDMDGVEKQMKKHADIMRPKFQAVVSELQQQLEGTGIGTWTNPNGGYFISFQTMPGCAKDVVAKCKEAGMVLTGAGATYPYGIDPEDSNIRIAPSYPSLEEMKEAAKLFALCVKLVSVTKLLEK